MRLLLRREALGSVYDGDAQVVGGVACDGLAVRLHLPAVRPYVLEEGRLVLVHVRGLHVGTKHLTRHSRQEFKPERR